MDKRKLIQIIEKELEELKVIAEEVSENEKDTGLVIEIALGKAKVLCSEIELLRKLNANENANQNLEPEEEINDNDEASDVNISDPELEIASVEDEEETIVYAPDEFDEADAMEDDLADDLTDEEDVVIEEDEAVEDDKLESEELIEFESGTELPVDDEEIQESSNEKIEYQIDSQIGFREINIEETEEEPEPIKTQPVSKTTERPVIREIPKPEEPVADKKVKAEPFQKGPTLNDTLGETKSPETTIKTGPITSLRAAIGLNDRFQFVREIFGNNTDKYNKVIDHLDKLETIQQAVDYLKSQLTLQKNETSMKFVDLLKRRFTK
jgi:hypothetical protein